MFLTLGAWLVIFANVYFVCWYCFQILPLTIITFIFGLPGMVIYSIFIHIWIYYLSSRTTISTTRNVKYLIYWSMIHSSLSLRYVVECLHFFCNCVFCLLLCFLQFWCFVFVCFASVAIGPVSVSFSNHFYHNTFVGMFLFQFGITRNISRPVHNFHQIVILSLLSLT